jgi:hypothetical protein
MPLGRDRSDLTGGIRLVRDVLSAIPPEADDGEDAVLRMVVEGYTKAATLAAKDAPGEELPSD